MPRCRRGQSSAPGARLGMAGRRRKLVDPHPGECELRTDPGPFRQAAHALEVRACRGGGHEPGGGQPVEHDERVVRASAQALGTSKEEHQLGTARRAFLHGAPRQVVKALVFVTRRGVERLLAAFLPVLALRLRRGCRCLNRQADGKHQVESNVRQQHRTQRPAWLCRAPLRSSTVVLERSGSGSSGGSVRRRAAWRPIRSSKLGLR